MMSAITTYLLPSNPRPLPGYERFNLAADLVREADGSFTLTRAVRRWQPYCARMGYISHNSRAFAQFNVLLSRRQER